MKLYVQNEVITNVSRETSTRTRYQTSGNLIIIATSHDCTPQKYLGAIRGSITEFSPSSRAGMRHYLRACNAEYQNMVTLTYPSEWPIDGQKVKIDLASFFKRCKRFWDDAGHAGINPSAFWFLEFQKRGAPHFHIFTTHFIPHDLVSRWWYEIVGSNDPKHLKAGTRCEKLRHGKGGLCAYASKYANKNEQKLVPIEYTGVGRFWGVFGDRSTSTAAFAFNAREASLPRVEFQITELKRQIKLALEMKKAKILVKKDGFRLLCVTDIFVMALLSRQINRIAGVLDDYRADTQGGVGPLTFTGDNNAVSLQDETEQNKETILHSVQCSEGGAELDRRFDSEWPPIDTGKGNGVFSQTTWLPVDSNGAHPELSGLCAGKFSKGTYPGSAEGTSRSGKGCRQNIKKNTTQIAWPSPTASYLACSSEDYRSARDGE